MTYAQWWSQIEPIGRTHATGGYHRSAWTAPDLELREWFVATAVGLGLQVTTDRNHNLYAWWGDPDRDGPGVLTGSHLDSVRDGGAYDGPLGVLSGFAAVDALQQTGHRPRKPIGVACFADEEGARFGVACLGSRLLTGVVEPAQALSLHDDDGTSLAEAMAGTGLSTQHLGRDDAALRRIGTFVELHIEQGLGLVDLGRDIAVGTSIWPHGRWRFDLVGRADHAGTTRLEDRADPMLKLAEMISTARTAAERHAAVATVGKVLVEPNSVNAIPSVVRAWLDARAPRTQAVQSVVADVTAQLGVEPVTESDSAATEFDGALANSLASLLDDAPRLATGAGHDAGVLSTAGIPTAMLFVRNPTGISHSPAEFAEEADCLSGVAALQRVLVHLTS